MDTPLNPSDQLFKLEQQRIQRSVATLKEREQSLRQLFLKGGADKEWLHYQLLSIQGQLDQIELQFALLCEQFEQAWK